MVHYTDSIASRIKKIDSKYSIIENSSILLQKSERKYLKTINTGKLLQNEAYIVLV